MEQLGNLLQSAQSSAIKGDDGDFYVAVRLLNNYLHNNLKSTIDNAPDADAQKEAAGQAASMVIAGCEAFRDALSSTRNDKLKPYIGSDEYKKAQMQFAFECGEEYLLVSDVLITLGESVSDILGNDEAAAIMMKAAMIVDDAGELLLSSDRCDEVKKYYAEKISKYSEERSSWITNNRCYNCGGKLSHSGKCKSCR
jgi:hypothetical protein